MPYEYKGHLIMLTTLAKRTGKSISYLSKVFSGDMNPSWQTAKKIAKAMNITLDEFDMVLEHTKKLAAQAKAQRELPELVGREEEEQEAGEAPKIHMVEKG